jgi:hypothetical protein
MRLVQLLLLTCAVGFASTLINPSFGPSDPNVQGIALDYDTQSISITISSGDQVTVVIDLDFMSGDASIYNSAGLPGVNQYIEPYGGYSVGDLFFFDPSAATTTWTTSCRRSEQCVAVPTNSSLAYALVLDGGQDLTSGDLYQIGPGSTDVSVEAAYQDRPVSVTPNAPGDTVGVYGSELVCQSGPGCPTNDAQYQITLNFDASTLPSWFTSEISDGGIGLEFSAADCGNVLLVTPPPATPEPGTLGMIAAGLGMLGFGLARRRRKN